MPLKVAGRKVSRKEFRKAISKGDPLKPNPTNREARREGLKMNELDKNEVEQNLRITMLEEQVLKLSQVIELVSKTLEGQLEYNETIKEVITLLTKVK